MEPLGLLREAKSVQFVDWSGPDMVGDVLRSGRVTYGHIPSGYGVHSIVETSDDPNVLRFPLRDGGYLKMTPLDGPPEHVDLTITYRPPDEQPEIAKTAVAMGAKSFWVHPGEGSSDEAKQICADAGVAFVEGVDIRDMVAAL